MVLDTSRAIAYFDSPCCELFRAAVHTLVPLIPAVTAPVHIFIQTMHHHRSILRHYKAVLCAFIVLASSSAFAAAAVNVHYSIEICAWRKKVLDGKTDRRSCIVCPLLDTGAYKLTFPQDPPSATAKIPAPAPNLTILLKLNRDTAVKVNGVKWDPSKVIKITKDIVIDLILPTKGRIEGTLDSSN
jgi:hypothetical protein